jgi:hypothetical protein
MKEDDTRRTRNRDLARQESVINDGWVATAGFETAVAKEPMLKGVVDAEIS